jgi:hypothetical protein
LKERFTELDLKNWSDVAKNGCAEPYNEKNTLPLNGTQLYVEVQSYTVEPAGSCLSLGHLSLRVDLGWSARAGE